jgi:3-deoxy-7-phosphoheptulonate synthase
METSFMDSLEKIRKEIKSVDERILKSLAERRKLSEQVIQAKDEIGAPIGDRLREEQLLENLIASGRAQGLNAHLITRVFHEIIDDSIRSKTSPKIEVLASAPVEAPDAVQEKEAKNKESSGYKLASRNHKPDDTVISIRDVKIGGPEFVVIAGPCAVESREQIHQCARQVKECGGQLLRGGCFKPRTSPYSFQGLGFEGLEMLADAGRKYDIPIVSEVISPADVETVSRFADVLQIGARNMQNFSLLREAGLSNRPVLLKRGMMSTMEEFLSAAEYILDRGNHQVILCERGIRTFETMTRNTLDLGSIPILKSLTHLPVIVDPSHAAGKRDLVVPLALASYAVGPHGLIVEIHPDPEKALSDGPQALRFFEFADLMRRIYKGTDG